MVNEAEPKKVARRAAKKAPKKRGKKKPLFPREDVSGERKKRIKQAREQGLRRGYQYETDSEAEEEKKEKPAGEKKT
ncbi:unnamed protein product [Caenorhabditis angaria]|uniref:Uncharacterized protein n=1 Tax=Caenorhabditis angaria TaxID=860376 RepID=A0A9P1N352_9PELO|nr:unnamed protein product [Caenorhabditis angaria]